MRAVCLFRLYGEGGFVRSRREARERDDISNVLDASREEDETLESEAEASVRHGAVLSQLEVPPVGLKVHASLLDRIDKDLHT
jgi:hypothetical protein